MTRAFLRKTALWTLVTGHSASAFASGSFATAEPRPEAERTEELPLVTYDGNALSPKAHSIRLGLQKFEYTPLPRLTIGTFALPWLTIPLLGGPIVNLHAKGTYYDGPLLHAALKSGVYFVSLKDVPVSELESSDFQGWILPVSHFVTLTPDPSFGVTLETTWVQTLLSGDVETAGDTSALGVGAQNSLQFALLLEQRVARWATLNLNARIAPFVIPVGFESEVETEGGTTAVIEAEVTQADATGAFAVLAGATFHYGVFHARIGAGYGNFFLPGPLFVFPRRGFVPDFDVYFVF